MQNWTHCVSRAHIQTVTAVSVTELDTELFTSPLFENRVTYTLLLYSAEGNSLKDQKNTIERKEFQWFEDWVIFRFRKWQKHIFHAGRQAAMKNWQENRLQPQLAKLTNPTTSVVSVPRVSFSLSGWACLACGFIGLFSPRRTISVPGCGCTAACRFGSGGQSGNLLFFSLNISRSHLISPGKRLSIAALWADQRKQGRKLIELIN